MIPIEFLEHNVEIVGSMHHLGCGTKMLAGNSRKKFLIVIIILKKISKISSKICNFAHIIPLIITRTTNNIHNGIAEMQIVCTNRSDQFT